ncbi:MAG: S-layer homology domain-containing protein [Clostridia bacterium]
MNNKIKYLALAGLMSTQMVAPCFASVYEQDILANMGIMTYYNGDFEENDYLTRGMMAKILVTASQYSDNVVFSSVSPFSDVSTSHWCSPYVSTAVNHGLLRGYLDGSFRPDDNIKVEEVVTAVLNLLGFTSFTGTYPYAQMNYAQSIGLLDGVNVTAGNLISRADTAVIIYNAMNTKNNSNQTHSSTLGYNTSELTLGDVLEKVCSSPTLTTSYNSFDGYKIYVDGKTSTFVPAYSLIYINENSKMVYAYTSKVSGVIQSINPNIESPSSITISGKTYSLSTTDAKLSVSFDGFYVNDYVTCILDKNGDIGAIVDFNIENTVGILTNCTLNSSGYVATLLTTNGDVITYSCSSDISSNIGSLYEITTEGTLSTKYYKNSLSGTFLDNTLSSKTVANNVKILDITEDVDIISVIPSRLRNVYLESYDILYVEYNEQGEISSLILNDVTKDSYSFGYMTDANNVHNGLSISSSFTYLLNGSYTSKNYSNITYSVDVGPFRILGNGSDFSTAKNLTEIKSELSYINQMYYTFEDGTEHTLSTDVVAFTIIDGTPVSVDIADVDIQNATFYYDATQKYGGAIRMIIV